MARKLMMNNGLNSSGNENLLLYVNAKNHDNNVLVDLSGNNNSILLNKFNFDANDGWQNDGALKFNNLSRLITYIKPPTTSNITLVFTIDTSLISYNDNLQHNIFNMAGYDGCLYYIAENNTNNYNICFRHAYDNIREIDVIGKKCIAIVYENNNAKIYVNGNLVDSWYIQYGYSFNILSVTSFTIGAYNPNGLLFYNLKYYNKPLSADEVYQDYLLLK